MEKFDDHYDELGIYDRDFKLIKGVSWYISSLKPLLQKRTIRIELGIGVAMACVKYSITRIWICHKAIKQSITSNGNASKEQVADMLAHILKTEDLPKQLESTDGLAAAVYHVSVRHGISTAEEEKFGLVSSR